MISWALDILWVKFRQKYMRKEDLQVLGSVQKLEKDQLLLMETPKTPQQQFLHLFGHRHLLEKKMIHKNLDNCVSFLPGSSAHNSLTLAYGALCILNEIEVPNSISPLPRIIDSWLDYFPVLLDRKKVFLGEIVLQEKLSMQEIQGYDLYLQYVNLISFDLWRVMKGLEKEEQQFFSDLPVKEELEEWSKIDVKHLDAGDLLTFMSSCLPKVLLNIILEKNTLPFEMREKYSRFECLFSNQAAEYQLRRSEKLRRLLKNIFFALLQMELSGPHAKFMMLLAMRFFYVYHNDRKIGSPEIIVYAYNKLTDDLRRSLSDEFALFFKVIQKLGHHSLVSFLSQKSVILGPIIESVRQNPMIGYPQEAASPYNSVDIAETISLERGVLSSRYFQVLVQFSIFYYRIVVENMDVTVRLYYLGEFKSQKAGRTLLFSHEKKEGEMKNCINAMKKGLYEFQFDNSYSWINGKTIRYENVVFSPLEIKTNTAEDWLPALYENKYMNVVANKDNIFQVTHRKVEPKIVVPEKTEPKQPTRNKTESKVTDEDTALLSRNKETYSLIITTPAHFYHYETDCPVRMGQKIDHTLKGKEEYRWLIEGKTISKKQELEQFLRGVPAPKPKEDEKTERLEYYQEEEGELGEEEGELSEEEYEVVEKDMEKSHIFTEKRYGEEVVQVQREEKKEKKEKRQGISCNASETEDFYQEDAQ